MWSEIVVLGAGGVAESLLYNLAHHQLHPIALFNRTRERAEALVERYSPSTEVVEEIAKIPRDAGSYIFALSDTVIPEIASKMPSTSGTWMHTSATVPLEELTKYHSQAAIFYPLNSFSPRIAVELDGVPLFYETHSVQALSYLLDLAKSLGLCSIPSTLTQRRRMHVAAVFTCNFVTHLLAKGSLIMHQEHLSFNLLKPLVEETIRKAFIEDPAIIQTGPARRGDRVTIQRHRKELQATQSDLIPIYDLLTSSILKQYHPQIDLTDFLSHEQYPL